MAEMADWILGHCPEVEKPRPEVDALLERRLFALKAFSPAGAKDDRRDALVLAGSLATDRKAFREVEPPPRGQAELSCAIQGAEAAPDLGRTWALRHED